MEHVNPSPNSKYTRRGSKGNPVIQCACGCGTELAKYDNEGRERRFVYGHQSGRKGDAAVFCGSSAKVVDALKAGPLTIEQICVSTGIPKKAVVNAIAYLLKKGDARRRPATFELK
jgi:hypothetical protein